MNLNREITDKVERLKNISLFQQVAEDDTVITDIARLFKTVSYPKGHNVIREKEKQGVSLYIIKSGTVEIIKKTALGDQYVVATLSAEMNIFFGEIALLDPDERSATVRCKTNCSFYVLDRDQFIRYGNENPKIGLVITRELSRILCRRLRKSNNDIVTLFDALVEEVEKSGGLL
jgi:CRP-like cAMP-binding protein